ncbi:MAG: ATP-binding protein, partial [Elusimicrobia bacterium]|nr:ATP-binding protein [Elusimicrobiota bacterium]
RALSALLRYDLSRVDVLKWVYFARQVFAVLVLSVVAMAGLSAYLSVLQAEDFMRDALKSEARAIAQAVARAAFVPLSLEDDEDLAALAASYRSVERIGRLRITDENGRARADVAGAGPATDMVGARADILPLREFQRGGGRPIGSVEVELRAYWIRARARRIAALNLVLSGALAAVVLVVGTLVVRRLVARTRELVGEARLVEEVQRVNADLEAFSYSVAHDLRSPLRAIDGFGAALLEERGRGLGEEGRDYLDRMRKATRRMGEIIDDLLRLSRVSRGELRREPVDLGALAREIAERLRGTEPGRDVEFVIAEGLQVEADRSLAMMLVANLLGNAWKYTARRAGARIEVGAAVKGGGKIFFVRDNGVGFDMAYVGKLFQPFSRLHAQGEFEGTGIGLATAARIVARHGGRIWGEGAVGRGATFYFTLEEGAWI